MTNDPLDLWPADLAVEPLTPVVILRLQADRLKERTEGRLFAEVVTTQQWVETGNQMHDYHRFEIVAPALHSYRYQLFTCKHDHEFIYPVYVNDYPGAGDAKVTANNQGELTEAIREILRSKRTTAVLQSLLARIREANEVVPA